MATPQPKELIHVAMAAILQDIVKITKDKKNETQGFKFRGIDDFYNHLHPIFSAHGVVCLPLVDRIDRTQLDKGNGKFSFYSIVTLTYRFSAKDGSFVEARCIGEGFDSGDKATAKALSAAHKYALAQTFLIPTADIAEGDFDSTVDARAEIAEHEAELKREQEIIRQEDELEKKRAALRQEAAAGLPAGATAVVADPKTVQEPAKPESAATTPPKADKHPGRSRSAAATTAKEPTATPESAKAPAATKPAPWEDFVISEDAINHASYKNRKLGDLSPEELVKLETNWIGRNAEGINKNPVKLALRKQIEIGLTARRAAGTIPEKVAD